MINLLDGIDYLRDTDPRLYLALKKFAEAADEHERRIKKAEDLLARISSYSSFCLVTANTQQTLSPGTWTNLNFDGEMFDQDNLHDVATNNERINIKHSGFYFLFGCVEFLAAGLGMVDVTAARIAISASAQDAMIRGTYGLQLGNVVVGFRHLRANSYVVMQGYFEAGGDTGVIADTTRPYFGVFRLPFDTESDLSGVPF